MAILPGSTLGMLGGGQLGRMFVIAARTMGYEVLVLDPDADSPAGKIASRHLQAAYDDREALDDLAQHCAAVSTEFENIPADTLDYLAKSLPVHPSASALRIAQNRVLEKRFFDRQGLNTTPYLAINSDADLVLAENFEYPAILKTATLGYDGKGQFVCNSFDELGTAYNQISSQACVLEKKIDLAMEVSVVLCRSEAGDVDCFPVAQNEHRNGILDISAAPAELSQETGVAVRQAARSIADGLDYCGVLAVEFFISTDQQVLVNEMAPRPHNSGHFTIDACETSQFEQQLRMMCGIPAGSSRQHSAVVMWNILGDLWPQDGTPNWGEVLGQGNMKLHLYGKSEARAGRKMGHINCLASDTTEARKQLDEIKKKLGSV
ncbi:MAG: 5-(carboxyamino)imidazole ribonucleotide synthase [Proteobacteria bacterium]|nr:5-(carboxyamino)imidazole ribonucleotide synthase [Pseudomonadota bacterium]